ncbi:MAG: inositol 2-dehydrogenase [Pseudomonadota bacterium]
MPNSINLALVGAGRIGAVHAKAVGNDSHAQLTAISDAFPQSARALSEKTSAAVMSVEEIAADTSIDGVIICTPTDTHADLIETFARAGKAIFCEKPIDLDVERVKRCLAVVKETGASLMVGFNRRFDPSFAATQRAIADGKIGDVELVQIVSRDPEGPPLDYIKSSGGLFCDMTIHDFDMARWLLGEEPVSLTAQGSVLVYPEIADVPDYDTASIILRTASGKQASITNSRRASYGYDQRIEVHGSKGMVHAENHRSVSTELANEHGYNRAPLHHFFMTRYTEAYAAEIAAFVRQIVDGESAEPDGNDGLRSLVLARAATASAREGRTVKIADFE